ncbi:MAG: hypothetical protein IPJ88_07945 [Myxococcales bacterium]|nr:MAG: hypothetical protein IPJ88_07945 [Myxococcales bacterium]
MALYCSKCGTKNKESASRCIACGYDLKQQAKKKFKGTMLMGAASSAPAPNPHAQAVPEEKVAVAQRSAHGTMLMGAASAAPAASPKQPHTQQPAATARTQSLANEEPSPAAATPARVQPSARAQAAAIPSHRPSAPQLDHHAPPPPPTAPRSLNSYASEALLPRKTNPFIWIMGAAAALGLIACLATAVVFINFVKRTNAAALTLRETLASENGRMHVGIALGSVMAGCKSDDCKSVADYFHPSLRNDIKTKIGLVDKKSLSALADRDQSEAILLSSTEDAPVADSLQLDPEQCVRVSSLDLKVIGCHLQNHRFAIIQIEKKTP